MNSLGYITETDALKESNRQLAAIGRNLNQIARVLNIEFRHSDKITAEMIELLVDRIDQHSTKVEDLIQQGHKRWGGVAYSGKNERRGNRCSP
ncbi:plasmid mobilization relaxosome protein MobC [Parashewanella curva]|uniref:plasmid mobilization relaxosome protein MobC n=1 Tax=Parashewanella curva TaxID=2338552 RepID=UPI001FB3D27D|nr:plasmid mobilization relaxosome protein MobC [Parashewanella curva]